MTSGQQESPKVLHNKKNRKLKKLLQKLCQSLETILEEKFGLLPTLKEVQERDLIALSRVMKEMQMIDREDLNVQY